MDSQDREKLLGPQYWKGAHFDGFLKEPHEDLMVNLRKIP